MKISIRSLLIFMTLTGCSMVILPFMDFKFQYLLIPFFVIIVVTLAVSVREFGRDSDPEPPNFS